jgi:hypothetical protein
MAIQKNLLELKKIMKDLISSKAFPNPNMGRIFNNLLTFSKQNHFKVKKVLDREFFVSIYQTIRLLLFLLRV